MMTHAYTKGVENIIIKADGVIEQPSIGIGLTVSIGVIFGKGTQYLAVLINGLRHG